MEQRYAAIHSGYTWREYLDLPGSDDWAGDGQDSKAKVIAFYRLSKLIEAIGADNG